MTTKDRLLFTIPIFVILLVQAIDIWSVHRTKVAAERLAQSSKELNEEVKKLDETMDRILDGGTQ